MDKAIQEKKEAAHKVKEEIFIHLYKHPNIPPKHDGTLLLQKGGSYAQGLICDDTSLKLNGSVLYLNKWCLE